jgi:hypothetical protein
VRLTAARAAAPSARALASPRLRLPALAGITTYRLAWTLAVGLFCWLLVFAWLQPLTPDEAVYKIVATGAVHGQWPYRDLFDHKPPLAYAWYLPAALGASVFVERIIAALCLAASVPLLALVARRWLTPRHAAIATVAYALAIANPGLSVRANLESFALLPLVAAFAVTSPLAAGALLGVAAMTKPMALLFAPVLVWIWRREAWKSAAAALIVAAAISLPFVPIWRDYWDANITFNMQYGAFTPNGDRLATILKMPPPVLIGWLPLIAAAIAGAWYVRDVRAWLVALGGVASVKLSGQQFNHYYTLLAPGVALFAGAGIAWAWPRIAARTTLFALAALSTLPVVFGFSPLITDYGDIHHPLGTAAAEISATPGEFYVLGDHGQSYVFADRQPQRRFFFASPAVVRPEWGDQLRADLIACPPAVLVVAEDALFPVPWQSDVTSLYTRKIETPAGAVYLDPTTTCTKNH